MFSLIAVMMHFSLLQRILALIDSYYVLFRQPTKYTTHCACHLQGTKNHMLLVDYSRFAKVDQYNILYDVMQNRHVALQCTRSLQRHGETTPVIKLGLQQKNVKMMMIRRKANVFSIYMYSFNVSDSRQRSQ